MVYDYLFKFDTEAEAIEALPDWYTAPMVFDGVEYPGQWNTSSVVPIAIIAQAEVWEGEELVQPRIDVPGYWLVIARPYVDDALYAVPQCVQETLRPTVPTPFQDTVTRTKLDGDDYAAFTSITPIWAGSAYVF